MHVIQALNTGSSSFLDVSAVSSFAKFYNLSVPDLEAVKCKWVFLRKPAADWPKTMLEFHMLVSELR